LKPEKSSLSPSPNRYQQSSAGIQAETGTMPTRQINQVETARKLNRTLTQSQLKKFLADSLLFALKYY
jgi:hypothetical protein